MKPIISVDLEEWFHILETDCISKNKSDWDKYENRIEDTAVLTFVL